MKLSLVAFSATILIAMTLPAAAAAAILNRNPPPPTTTTTPCMVDCVPDQPDEPEDSTTPGEPFLPVPECQINCVPNGGPGPDDEPEVPDLGKPSDEAALDLCGDKLGFLRDVTVSQVESVGTDDLVDIVPVCKTKTLATEQEDVAELRPVIGENIKLDSELDADGYNAEDVVGVIVDGQNVILYVHRL
jgi:hypothetical protein